MSISKFLLVAAGIVCFSTPVEAQETGRNLDGSVTIVNPLCGKRPSGQARGTTLKPVIKMGADGKEYCIWSPTKYDDRAGSQGWTWSDPCIGYQGDIYLCRRFGPMYGRGTYQSGSYYSDPNPQTSRCRPNPDSMFFVPCNGY